MGQRQPDPEAGWGEEPARLLERQLKQLQGRLHAGRVLHSAHRLWQRKSRQQPTVPGGRRCLAGWLALGSLQAGQRGQEGHTQGLQAVCKTHLGAQRSAGQTSRGAAAQNMQACTTLQGISPDVTLCGHTPGAQQQLYMGVQPALGLCTPHIAARRLLPIMACTRR